MKLRGTFTCEGLEQLSKGFLPTIEKCGGGSGKNQTVQALFSAEAVHLVQLEGGAGVQAIARFTPDVLFVSDTYKCVSKYQNLIAFDVDAALLQRVLRGAHANNADEQLAVRLTSRPVQGLMDPGQTAPFLAFQGLGRSLDLEQDLPVGKPYVPSEVDALVATTTSRLCPFYVDMAPCVSQAAAMLDRMKGLSDSLLIAVTKAGDLHLMVSETSVALGIHIARLAVYPPSVALAPDDDARQGQAAEQLLQAALDEGTGTAAASTSMGATRTCCLCTATGTTPACTTITSR